MRNELEQIKKIEEYLKGELSAEEKVAFEAEMDREPGLRQEVQLQAAVMKGIERASLTQKVQQAGQRFRRGRNFRNWGGGGLAVLVLAAGLFLVGRIHGDGSITGPAGRPGVVGKPGTVENIGAQVFDIDAGADTVVVTKGGMVLSVPARDFRDGDGQLVTGRLHLEIKEALDAASILKAGLSTRSGDRLLETGGMFSVQATKDGRLLGIDPAKGISVEVPTDTVKPGMQLFKGRRKADGEIDWVDPRPLERQLVSVDVKALDFYPPHYRDSVRAWGYDAGDRRFIDSLYYSFAAFMGFGGDGARDSTSFLPVAGCGINPAKIKTIRSDRFQKTLVATREFEQRMPWIHRAGEKMLDLYIENLDKNISTIDSMAAGRVSGELKERFLSFAGRRDGKVKNGVSGGLYTYYRQQAAAYTNTIGKAVADYWHEQNQLDLKYSDHQLDSLKVILKNYQEELAINLTEAYRQVGHDDSVWLLHREVYRAQITDTGWFNLDKYVIESTLTRTTLNAVDPLTGKTAVIRYLPVAFQVEGASGYDRLNVYLLPDRLSSYMRIADSGGIFRETLNELIQYDLVCIGYKGEQVFFYTQEKVKPGNYGPIRLRPIGSAELDKELGSTRQANVLRKEDAFYREDRKDQKRRKDNEERVKLGLKMQKFLFPCLSAEEVNTK